MVLFPTLTGSDMGDFFLSFMGYPSIFFSVEPSVRFATEERNVVDVLYSDRSVDRIIAVEQIDTITLDPFNVTVFTESDRDRGFLISVPEGDRVSVHGDTVGSHIGGFLALPCAYLPTDEYEYYALTGTPNNTLPFITSFLVVACEDDTRIDFTPTQLVTEPDNPSAFVAPGESRNLTLNSMQTLYIRSSADLSGSRVVANKPVSFFAGSLGTNPEGRRYLVEQLPPTSMWGYFFLTAPIAGEALTNIFKVVALQDFTLVPVECTRENGTTFIPDTLFLSTGDVGEFETPSDAYCVISASSPILVIQLTPDDGALMITVPPINHYTNNITFTTALLVGNHFVNVFVTPEFYNPEFITIDGEPISSWVEIRCFEIGGQEVDICGYAAQVSVASGFHTVRHEDSEGRLMATVYAYPAVSYGHLGGVELAVPDGKALTVVSIFQSGKHLEMLG